MRILLFGTSGQVGWELRRALLPLGEVIAISRQEADFNQPESLRRCFENINPALVVNAVAYTAVDLAESESDVAECVNAAAVAVLADEAAKWGALLIHYSTDYVFDGESAKPYVESDIPNPQGAYGRSKRAGELAVEKSPGDFLILRTSWVYATRGKNFVRTMLKFAAERDQLRVVADQHGAPTSARLIADCTAQIAASAVRERAEGRFKSALLHLTASGATTWHGLAMRVIDAARRHDGAMVRVNNVEPIATSQYPTPAKRPMNSRLDTTQLRERFHLHLPDWTVGVDLCLEELLQR